MINQSRNGEEARALLDHVESVQRQTRAALGGFWFPLVLFGALGLASVPAYFIGDGAVVAAFWAVAGVGGGVATGWYYHGRQQRLGVSQAALPYVIVAGVLFVAAFVLPALTTGRLQEVVSSFAVAAAYLVFAIFERSRVVAALAVVIAGGAVLSLASGLDHPGAVTAAVTGLSTLGVGMVARRSSA